MTRRAELTVEGLDQVWWQPKLGYVSAKFFHVEGLEAVARRALWARITKRDLARILGAFGPRDMPDWLLPHLGKVLAWLDSRADDGLEQARHDSAKDDAVRLLRTGISNLQARQIIHAFVDEDPEYARRVIRKVLARI